jgi:hypothetical protein
MATERTKALWSRCHEPGCLEGPGRGLGRPSRLGAASDGLITVSTKTFGGEFDGLRLQCFFGLKASEKTALR